jgi:hypothetical protein
MRFLILLEKMLDMFAKAGAQYLVPKRVPLQGFRRFLVKRFKIHRLAFKRVAILVVGFAGAIAIAIYGPKVVENKGASREAENAWEFGCIITGSLLASHIARFVARDGLELE